MAESIITVSLNPSIDRVLEVDKFTLGAHQLGREILRTPGGKAINVSRVLATLGVRNVATGFLGADNRQQFDQVLKDSMIRDEFFVIPGRTRENVTIVDRLAKQETHIRDVGLPVGERDVDRLMKKLELMTRRDCFVIFSGSLPPGVSPTVFRQMVEGCLAGGAHVAVDTSGEALREVADLNLWLIKPNAVELADWAGHEVKQRAEQLTAGRDLAGRMANVVFTVGEEGAFLFHGGAAVHGFVPVDPAAVKSTVGSGDAMLAGFVAAAHRGRDSRQAFAEGLACAAAKVCSLSPAEIKPAMVAEFRTKVRLEEVEG